MKLSQETTIISPEKLRDYVINISHPDGESKAQFLQSMGYEQDTLSTMWPLATHLDMVRNMKSGLRLSVQMEARDGADQYG